MYLSHWCLFIIDVMLFENFRLVMTNLNCKYILYKYVTNTEVFFRTQKYGSLFIFWDKLSYFRYLLIIQKQQLQTWACQTSLNRQMLRWVSVEMVWRKFQRWAFCFCCFGLRTVPRSLVKFCSLSPARRRRKILFLAEIHSHTARMSLG